MSTVTTAHGASESDTVRPARCHSSRTLPLPNRLGKARGKASRGRKFFVATPPPTHTFFVALRPSSCICVGI